MLQLQRPLVVLDLETTGISLSQDRIVEISMLKIYPDATETILTYRINPLMPIPQQASEIHGIYDKDVANCPSFARLAPDIFNFLDNCDIAGYNSNYFDIPLLTEEFLRVNLIFKTNDRFLVDVYKIFQKKERRDLQGAYRFYCQKELKNAHSAEADVRATYEVLLAQINQYPTLANDVQKLHDFSLEANFLDSGRSFVISDDGIVRFNFGKHKGKPVEEILKSERQYYDWIMKSDFPRDTKQKLTEIKENMKK